MILVDAGPLIAAWAPRDPFHEVVRRFLRIDRDPRVVPVPVVTEVGQMLLARVGIRAEAAFLRWMSSGAVTNECPGPSDYARAADLREQYADFPLGTVDALIVAIAERLEVTRLLTLDRGHFGAIRPLHCEAFEILP